MAQRIIRQALLFLRDRPPNDGLSSAMVTVLTLDEYGYPVGNIVVDLKVVGGDGTLPAQVTTDDQAWLRFTSPPVAVQAWCASQPAPRVNRP